MQGSEAGLREPSLRKLHPPSVPGGHGPSPHSPLVELLEGVRQEDGRAAGTPSGIDAMPLSQPDPALQGGQE
eukprot:13984645-Alexandrium_andersonii.AAC.1